ncbi:hypothetical protein SERLA73DRAFT_189864 [Serpula lacrymans var. lacrymans S7.3]|uniref:DNA-(apurinic or apyrimidinic site) lyase n=2 Tax=Serpula lacrymans var. lacrymans TaxID=341189 RepID=F8QEP4_SERL3|nr:uncharacterized protein SERLADRAFT_481001 [Serpula lacrymans var. lacrymans S7.9]EGN93300.1 hypothetical protein SERLA73DRAFT_189864 [Serpula lacrymans var. lacrymans S7.3]EGO18677.1 hypothetical protein SERLADRAFT_481001 [Serpula lacrymans var. lacrymans S7.9]
MRIPSLAMIPGFCELPLPIIQLSLAAVLKCGQSFRWSAFPLHVTTVDASTPTHEYRLCLRDRVVCLRQTPNFLFYRSVFPKQLSPTQQAVKETETLAWLRDYFQLEVDLVELYDQWSARDAVFDNLRSRFSGIRMLRQDPWENLISFICSSNNNISRITKMVQSLCKQYSTPLLSLPPPHETTEEQQCQSYHPFPSPSALAAPEVVGTLRSLGFGYRASFIQRTAKMLVDTHGHTSLSSLEASEEWLMTLRDLTTDEAREELLKFMGVGRKVADCVLLMSMDKKDVIPVDTHVHQIAIKHYGFPSSSSAKAKASMTPKLYEKINVKLVNVWGNYAGWAHSVLFTADLKSFSSYGLPSTSRVEARGNITVLPTPPLTPSPSKLKRKRHPEVSLSPAQPETDTATADVVEALGVRQLHNDLNLEPSLADRVKRRRRVAAVA